MKMLKVIVALTIILALSASLGYTEPVFKGNNLYDGWEHEVWVDDETGEVTIIGHPTEIQKSEAERKRLKQLEKYERYLEERRKDYNRDQDRKTAVTIQRLRSNSTVEIIRRNR